MTHRRFVPLVIVFYLLLWIFVAQTTEVSTEDFSTMVIVDRWWVSKSRCNVYSMQNVSFHAIWAHNGSPVQGGSIYVDEKVYITNASGWISFSYSSPIVHKKTWVVTAVNASGTTSFTTLAENPSIICDRIEIYEGGVSADRSEIGKEQTVWYKAQYEYDSETFNSSKGVLHLNGSAITWSTPNNRWEYTYTLNVEGTRTFQISGVVDARYGINAVNDIVGPKSITWFELPPDPPHTPLWMQWWLWAIIVGVVVAIAVIFMIRKKKPEMHAVGFYIMRNLCFITI